MKHTRRFILAIIIFLLAAAVPAAAAGSSVTASLYQENDNGIIIQLQCVGDSANGTVPATMIVKSDIGLNYQMLGYYLWEVWVRANSPAPDAADIVITDQTGAILFTEANVIAASGTKEGDVTKARMVTSLLTVTQANQATVDAQWTIFIKLVKSPMMMVAP
jgi:hypothetical protein